MNMKCAQGWRSPKSDLLACMPSLPRSMVLLVPGQQVSGKRMVGVGDALCAGPRQVATVYVGPDLLQLLRETEDCFQPHGELAVGTGPLRAAATSFQLKPCGSGTLYTTCLELIFFLRFSCVCRLKKLIEILERELSQEG